MLSSPTISNWLEQSTWLRISHSGADLNSEHGSEAASLEADLSSQHGSESATLEADLNSEHGLEAATLEADLSSQHGSESATLEAAGYNCYYTVLVVHARNDSDDTTILSTV